MEKQTEQEEAYTIAYIDFHKSWESTMNSLVQNLNVSKTSEEAAVIIRGTEEVENKMREFPFSLPEEQASNMRQLGDVLDEAKFKFTHIRKLEIAEQSKLLQAQVDAWGLPTKPLEAPFQVILSRKKGRKNSGDSDIDPKKAKKDDDIIPTQNKFAELTVSNSSSMDFTDPQEGTSATSGTPVVTAPQKKHHVPPITINNVSNQAALLKHLQGVTKLKLEAKLIGTKFRIYPQTPYAYTLIRRYIEENSLEGYTYMLPEDRKLRAVIRGLPIDMPPMEIISDLATQGYQIEECHNMVSRKTGAPMPLFMLSMERSEQHKSIFQNVTSIAFVKVIVEILRKKYGPPQCYRCQGFFHSSKFCTRTPRCVKCAGNHLAKECEKELNDKPKCCLCGGEHPANFLGCPKNLKLRIEAEKERKQQQKSARIVPVPEPPKTNYWEQRAKNATPRQQPPANTQPGPSTVPPPPIHKNNSQEDPTDIFAQLKNPAVQETFDLLEQFITIATTIPSKVGRLRAIRNLLADEIHF
ncbi:nucleic-acid-binding protein from transposon X-element [Trichonephila clavata]|uniref:Nucleic-acid-binding protein from transposon X-element n=1 Tax=Trichonephila clavata TaxID=2740835 RepID=A0A8X6JXV9_TRICU|nr:nucleic-acid-binding protein from transposon X-element [Trichonephila clavata]